MSEFLEYLAAEYPLLQVLDPKVEIMSDDYWTPLPVPDEMFPLMTEYIVRYAFVSGKSHKGEQGAQKQLNSDIANILYRRIRSLGFEGRFTMPFYGFNTLVKIDFSERFRTEQIEFSFINHLSPAVQEAATV